MNALRHPDRPFCRVRVHAPRAGRNAGARARCGADRRVPDAAAHESGRRRHGARRAARRRGWISALRAQSVRHGGRRPDRRLRRRGRGRADCAHHGIEGGRFARRVLHHLAGARRHHCLSEGHQHRPSAFPVRNRAGARQPDAAADCAQCHRYAVRDGVDLPAAGARVCRSRLPALGEPGRRAGAYRLSCAARDQPGQRLPRARHACSRSAS